MKKMKVQLNRTKAEKLFKQYQNLADNVRELSAIVQNPYHANVQDLDQFLYISKQAQASISSLTKEVSQLYQDAQSSKFYTVCQNNSGGYFINNEHVAEYLIIEARSESEYEKRRHSITDVYSEYCPCCGERWYSWDDEGYSEPMIHGAPAQEHIDSHKSFHEKEAIIYYLDGTTKRITRGGN